MTQRFVVNHLGHCVTNLERAQRFYQEVLGFEFWRELTPPQEASAQLLGLDEPLDSRIVFLRRDGFVLELIHYGAPEHQPAPRRRRLDEPGLTHLSVSCDVAEVSRRVSDYGGEVLTDTDIGVALFVRDPDGQLIELLPLDYAERMAQH